MNHIRTFLGQHTSRWAVAVAATLGLVAGGAWYSVAAGTKASQAVIAQPAPTRLHVAASGRDSYADVVKAVAPAVVTVRAQGRAKVSPTVFGEDDDLLRRFFGDQFGRGGRPAIPRTFKQRALGSGVIVTNDGYILTNNHVIDGADDIRVDLTEGRSLKAKLVGSDKPSDLALLKIEANDLKALPLANSDAVEVGDVVLAVGNPLDLGQTVTMGIISAKGRSTRTGDGGYEDFLQTDAPINHGNSGGALVNTSGELVGINSQIISPSDGNIGIGFAIPSNMARHVLDALKANGRVQRAQLGVVVQPVTSEMAESLGLKDARGAIVSDVKDGSAADRAGLKRGDIIKSFNGQPVQDTNMLRNRVADTAPGSSASVVIVRDGGERTLNVKLDEATAPKSVRDGGLVDSDDKAALGVSVAPLTPELATRLGLPKTMRGIVVEQVSPDGRAADAGIQAGDVIVEVNRQPVQSVEELKAAVRRSQNRPTLVLVNRNGQNTYLTVASR